MCRNTLARTKHKRNRSVNLVESNVTLPVESEPTPSETDVTNSDSLFTIYMTKNSSVPSIVVTPTVNGIP